MPRRAIRLRPVTVDVVRALVTCAATVTMTLVYNDRGTDSPHAVGFVWIALLVLATAPVGLARTAPFASATASLTVCFLGSVADLPMAIAFVPALLLVGYAVFRSDVRRGGAVAVLSGTLVALTALARADHDHVVAAAAGFAVGLLPALLAERLRANRVAAGQAAERARRIEELRDLDVQRAVADERLRIARDLHDITGHHLSAIALRAGGAMSTTRDPNAGAALRQIHELTRDALNQTRRAVGLLREQSDGLPVAPLPRLDALGHLLDPARESGIEVTLEMADDLPSLPELVEVCAYRIVQESVTNVLRHATARSVLVVVGFDLAQLTILVEDAGPHVPRPATAGAGLTGMRERVELVGGTLCAGPYEHGWRVRAALPVEATR